MDNDQTAFCVEDADESPGLLLWQTTTLWQHAIKKALLPYGVTHPHFVMLAILRWFFETKQYSTQAQIVIFSKLDKMTISNGLKILSQKELVARFESSLDTRMKEVVLTQDGHRISKELIQVVEAM